MVMRRVCFVIGLVFAGNLACEQLTEEQRAVNTVLLVSAYMDQCIRADELLRTSCARVKQHLSENNKKYCQLPTESFEKRTTQKYRAFQESYRAEIGNNKAKVDAVVRKSQQTFENQFAQLRAGKISMPDLELQHRILDDTCSTVEREWLSSTRTGR